MFGDNQFRYALLSLAACEAPLQLHVGGYRCPPARHSWLLCLVQNHHGPEGHCCADLTDSPWPACSLGGNCLPESDMCREVDAGCVMVMMRVAGLGRRLGSHMATKWSFWRMTGMPAWCPLTSLAGTGSMECTRCASRPAARQCVSSARQACPWRPSMFLAGVSSCCYGCALLLRGSTETLAQHHR